MGVEQVARTMARRALTDAIADVSAQQARQTAISHGLIGAVLNALEKGVPEGEVAETLRSNGGADAVRAALAISIGVITEQQREALDRLVQQELEPAHTEWEQRPSVVVENIAAWGPLSAEALGEVFLMAADVAGSDRDHDLTSALDVLNEDVLGPSRREQLHAAEKRQVAQVLLALVPAIEFDRSLGNELATVNAWVVKHMDDRERGGSAVSELAELLRRAAAALVEKPAPTASREGGGEHA